MATAAMTSFDSLPYEIVLKIIKMAALTDEDTFEHTGVRYSHEFIQGVLFKVSVRFRQIATDSSLWKGHVSVYIDRDIRELDFVIRECLNSGTKVLGVYEGLVHPPFPTLAFPNRYLIDIATDATKFANLKRVVLEGRRLVFEEDIPAPWRVEDEDEYKITLETTGRHIKVLTRD